MSNVLNSKANPQYISTDEKLNMLENLQYDDLFQYLKNLKFDNCVALFEGNVNNVFIEEMTSQIKRLNYNGVDNYVTNEIIQPTVNTDFVISKVSENPKELNDCILVSYCYGKSHFLVNSTNFKLVALANIVDLFVAEPFFDELRTKQQLGYTVYSYGGEDLGRCFEKLYMQNFLVQSPNTPCEELLNRINTFIQQSVEKMNVLDDTTFETYINTLKIKLLKPDDSLKNMATTDLGVIIGRHTLFNYKQLVVNELESLTKDDLINFFLEHYSTNVKRYVVNLTSTCLNVNSKQEHNEETLDSDSEDDN
jgi:nardilysin